MKVVFASSLPGAVSRSCLALAGCGQAAGGRGGAAAARRHGQPPRGGGRHRLQRLHRPDGGGRVGPGAGHVWGYLDKINFKEGAEVKKGDVLFKIDPRPYSATLAQAEANLKQAEAHRASMADTYARDRASPAATPEATRMQDQGNLAEAEAAVDSARAARDAARLNLDIHRGRRPGQRPRQPGDGHGRQP